MITRKHIRESILTVIFMSVSMFISAQTFNKPNDPGIKFTGAYFNKISDTAVIFRRHSYKFLALTDWNVSMASDDNAKTTTGVTIDFATDAERIDLHLKMLPGKNTWNLYATCYIDGDSTRLLKQKRDDLTAAGDSSFMFSVAPRTAGVHTYKFVLGTYNTVALEGVTLTGGSETLNDLTLPVKPSYVVYGNSITHGQGQDTGDQTYPWLLAKRMGWELYNIAVGGSKTSVPMAEMLRDEVSRNIDYMTILIGYNDAVWLPEDTAYYHEKLTSFINTVRQGHPETIIFVLGQTYTLTTEDKNGNPVDFDDWRKVQKQVAESFQSAGDTKIHYINGETFTDYSSLNNPPDDPVHLSEAGAYSFGNALADTILKILEPSTGIFTEKKNNNNISVFPNPVKSSITVMTDTGSLGDLELFNITGEIVFITYSGSNTIKLNIEDLPKGIYILKTKTGIKKILKQ